MERREEKNATLRSILLEHRRGDEKRELTLTTLNAAGAVPLTIMDLLPTLNNNHTLPTGITIQRSVTGNDVYPVSLDDVECEELDETASLSDDQSLTLDKITPEVYRAGVTILISNHAIKNAAFDLLGFVQQKFGIAVTNYIARRLYATHTAYNAGLHGPFAGAPSTEWQGNMYQGLLQRLMTLADAGVDISQASLIMDHTTEAEMKFTPTGGGRMIISDGKCCELPYVATNYFNHTPDGERINADSVGIFLPQYMAIQEHDGATIQIDGSSLSVARKNCTALTLNTFWSMTNLGQRLQDREGQALQPFQLYDIRAQVLADADGNPLRTADGRIMRVKVLNSL